MTPNTATVIRIMTVSAPSGGTLSPMSHAPIMSETTAEKGKSRRQPPSLEWSVPNKIRIKGNQPLRKQIKAKTAEGVAPKYLQRPQGEAEITRETQEEAAGIPLGPLKAHPQIAIVRIAARNGTTPAQRGREQIPMRYPVMGTKSSTRQTDRLRPI
jgi:hypothetical protein